MISNDYISLSLYTRDTVCFLQCLMHLYFSISFGAAKSLNSFFRLKNLVSWEEESKISAIKNRVLLGGITNNLNLGLV